MTGAGAIASRARVNGRGTVGLGLGLVLAATSACSGASAGTEGPGRAVPAVVRAECPGVSAAADSARRQVRGMWIATVENTDWPRAGASQAQQKAAYDKLLDRAVALGLNTVFVQVRSAADAFYASPYEPWSKYLSGVAGRDPGWDVLGYLVQAAHARDLSFQAWFNPYRVSLGADRKALPASSPARRHPGWVVSYGGQLYYNPGLPQVRQLVTDVVLDVVRKYDIDGVHLDDYFYPYPGSGSFNDAAAFRAYGKGLSLGAWRRQNVNELVQGLSAGIHGAKAWVQFGISPFGVWRNSSTDSRGSRTAALQSYDEIYADSLTWVRKGWLDYVVPQLYWPMGDSRADYTTLVRWWARAVQGSGTLLYVGQAGYQVGTGGVWNKAGEIAEHVALDATIPQVRGEVFFSAANVVSDVRGWMSRVRSQSFTRPALLPSMVRLSTGAAAPVPPSGLAASAAGAAVRLSWSGGSAVSYAVYRVAGRRPGCVMPSDGDLLATLRSSGGARVGFTDSSAVKGATYTYYVTALDRLDRQSGPAKGAVIVPGRG